MVDIGANFKSIQRRVHNIDYTKTHLASGYEETEEKYRKLRDVICIYKSNIEDFMHYEHGGKTMKTIKEGLTTIGKRLKDDYFKNDSMYQQGALVLDSMAFHSGNGSDMCKKYSGAMKNIERAKSTFNEKMEQAIVEIQRFEKDSEKIDKRRVEVKNKRYDLEKLLKKPVENQEKVNGMSNEFNSIMQSVLTSMNAFIGDKGMGEVVKNVKKAHYDFSKAYYEAMKSVN